MATTKLTFDDLRQANLRRIPLFKNSRGEVAHPPSDCDDGPGSDWSLGEWVCALSGEVGEAANVVKKIRRGDVSLAEARQDLADELADVACYLDIVAMRAGVDLGEAIAKKFNEVSRRVCADVFLGEQPEAVQKLEVGMRGTCMRRDGKLVARQFSVVAAPDDSAWILIQEGPSIFSTNPVYFACYFNVVAYVVA